MQFVSTTPHRLRKRISGLVQRFETMFIMIIRYGSIRLSSVFTIGCKVQRLKAHWKIVFLLFLFVAPNLKSDSDSDLSPSNSEEEDEEKKEEKREAQPKTPSKTNTGAAALYKTPAKKSKKAPEVGRRYASLFIRSHRCLFVC